MRARWRVALTTGTTIAALTVIPAPVQAQYLDPGTGSIIVQVVIAVAVGVVAACKLYWGKLSALVTRRSKRDVEG